MVRHTPPEQLHYDAIEAFLRASISSGAEFLFNKTLFENELQRLWETYNVDYATLQSFIRNLHVVHVKKTAHTIKDNLPHIIQDILKENATILEISRQRNFPPYLLTRNILETIIDFANVGDTKKKVFSDLLRDPHLLKNFSLFPMYRNVGSKTCARTLLECQVKEAIDVDPMYGVESDRYRHLVGIEYEVVLEHYLNSMSKSDFAHHLSAVQNCAEKRNSNVNSFSYRQPLSFIMCPNTLPDIPFESEAQLRDRGTSKTPDVLLQYPIGIPVEVGENESDEPTKWKMICWIDSKALFGDIDTHRSSVLPQAQSYVHRFGPGLVIYWMGHAVTDHLDEAHGDVTVIGRDLPQKIMLPSGKTISAATIGSKSCQQQSRFRLLSNQEPSTNPV